MDHIYAFRYRLSNGEIHFIERSEPDFEIAARDASFIARDRGWTLLAITDEDEDGASW